MPRVHPVAEPAVDELPRCIAAEEDAADEPALGFRADAGRDHVRQAELQGLLADFGLDVAGALFLARFYRSCLAVFPFCLFIMGDFIK